MSVSAKKTCRVGILHDGAAATCRVVEPMLQPLEAQGMSFTFESVAISAYATLQRDLRRAACSGRFDVFINAMPNLFDSDNDDRHTSAQVTRLLDEWNVPHSGVPARYVELSAWDARMLAFYNNLKVLPFVDATKATSPEEIASLKVPVAIRPHDGIRVVAKADTHAALRTALAQQLKGYPRLIVEEVCELPAVTRHTILAFSAMDEIGEIVTKTVVLDMDRDGRASKSQSASVAELCRVGETMLKALGKEGWLRCEAVVLPDATVCVTEVEPNCSLDLIMAQAPSATNFVLGQVVGATRRHETAQLTYENAFDHKMRGYRTRAARDIKKGEVVFRDEGHAFPIVTKGHVLKTWSAEDKETFARYGWPLDSDGHVYAIWEDDPKKWRPINHSCDPCLQFDEGHSLNVIATRDIPCGEDLTLDYATFCDFTMQPFQCFCGSASCRGIIRPDAASLAKYGTHAWHRRMPAAAEPTKI